MTTFRKVLCLLAVFLIACTAVVTSGCRPGPAEAIKIRISDPNPKTEGNAFYQAVLVLEEELDKAFPGQFEIEYYPSAMLYNAAEGIRAVLAGSIEAAYAYDGLLYSVLGEETFPMMITMMPGLAPTYDCYKEQIETLWPLLSKEFVEPRGGIVRGGYSYSYGSSIFATSPLYNVDDLKGKRIRVPPGAIPKATGEAYGIQTVTLDPAEVVPALQTGTIDGLFTTPAWAYRNRIYDVCGYMTPSSVPGSGSAGFFLWNLNWYNSLPEDVRETLENTIFPKMTDRMCEVQDPLIVGYKEYFEAEGLTVCEWTDEALKESAEALEVVWEMARPMLGDKWVDMAFQIKAKYE